MKTLCPSPLSSPFDSPTLVFTEYAFNVLNYKTKLFFLRVALVLSFLTITLRSQAQFAGVTLNTNASSVTPVTVVGHLACFTPPVTDNSIYTFSTTYPIQNPSTSPPPVVVFNWTAPFRSTNTANEDIVFVTHSNSGTGIVKFRLKKADGTYSSITVTKAVSASDAFVFSSARIATSLGFPSGCQTVNYPAGNIHAYYLKVSDFGLGACDMISGIEYSPSGGQSQYPLVGGFWNTTNVTTTASTPPAISVQPAVPTACAGTAASFSVSATGPGLTYLWEYSDDGVNFSSLSALAADHPGYNLASMSTTTYSSTRKYRVVVTSGVGCSVTSNAVGVTILSVSTPTASVSIQPTCAVNTGTIDVTAPTGAGITYSIDGVTYQSSATFTTVAPGSYSITAKNSSGCISSGAAVVVDPVPVVAVPTATVTDQPSCTLSTGTITVTGPTGAGVTYSVDGTNYQSGTIFSGLVTGTYSVTAQSTGCISSAVTVIVSAVPNCNTPPVANPVSILIAQPTVGAILTLNTPAPSAEDLEDGTLGGSSISNTLVIAQLFDNGAELYYNGILCTLNQEITNFNAANLTLKLVGNGYTSTTGRFTFRDSGGLLGTDAAYTVSWNNPLPVTLTTFTLGELESSIHLKWQTTKETNAEYFEIQRSSNAKAWDFIGKIAAAGESDSVRSYNFKDIAPFKGANYYRLRMVDKDASFAYSKIQSIKFTDEKGNLALYPNPVSERLLLKDFEIKNLQEISITDMKGKVVLRSPTISADGLYIGNLPNNIYTVKVLQKNGSVTIKKIAIIK